MMAGRISSPASTGRAACNCVWKMVALSLPAVAALSLVLRRGAPTDSVRHRARRQPILGGVGRLRFRLRLPIGRPALHRRVVHGRLRHRDGVRAARRAPFDALVTSFQP